MGFGRFARVAGLVAGVFIGLLILTGPGMAQTSATHPLSLTVATGVDPTFGHYVVAVKQGFFEKEGISANLKPFNDGNYALDALLTERNITEAGRRVFLTQSAMSGALARLREHFADELLIQVGRKMMTTPLADSLADPVREILLKIDAAIKTRPEFDPGTSHRRFSIMMSDYVSTLLMPEVLRRAEALAPRVTFEVLSNDAKLIT